MTEIRARSARSTAKTLFTPDLTEGYYGPDSPYRKCPEPNVSRSIGYRRLIGRVAVRPALWPELARAAWRFRRRDWYRRFPFVPRPAASYLDWRMHTAYGDEGTGPDTAELKRYLRWTRRMSRSEPIG